MMENGVMAAEHSVSHHMNKFKIHQLNCNNITQYYNFYSIFDQINADYVSKRGLFQKHLIKQTDIKD